MGIEVAKGLSALTLPIEQECGRKLLTTQERKAGCYIRHNMDALQRGNHAQQIDSAVKRITNGLSTIDEERALMDLPPYPDGIGSQPRIAANTVQLGQNPSPTVDPLPQPEADLERKGVSQATFAAKPHIMLSHFEAMIADAAARVHTKTSKAIDNARTKHAANAAAYTAWSNVFTAEQTHYAATAIAPVFRTYSNLAGTDTAGWADRCGTTYGRQLGQHLIDVAHGGSSGPPDLAQIALTMEDNA
jgi:hypothetical protein